MLSDQIFVYHDRIVNSLLNYHMSMNQISSNNSGDHTENVFERVNRFYILKKTVSITEYQFDMWI
jgi:hypothetical protein